jgi:hypothetical protein
MSLLILMFFSIMHNKKNNNNANVDIEFNADDAFLE